MQASEPRNVSSSMAQCFGGKVNLLMQGWGNGASGQSQDG